MKMTLLFIRHIAFIVISITGSFGAQGADNREILEIELTLSLRDVPLRQVISEIELSTGVRFVYSRNFVNPEENVTINVLNKKLGEVLNEILIPRNLRYTIHGNGAYIVVTQRKRDTSFLNSLDTLQSLLALDRVRVSGKVVDVSGQPMVGVNILIKGTTTGTSTDNEGNFSIEASSNDVLVFSFIGYKTLELPSSSVLGQVVLEEDAAVLNAVTVNAGYWTVSQREQTGSIATVTSKDISKQVSGNPLASIAGRLPGVYVTQAQGFPGASFSIQIRGRNSLRTDGNNPLYIVDGVPFPSTSFSSSSSILASASPLNNINPSDIESIEILKDADATAIYGTRGANGVVLITTKKAAGGKTKVDLQYTTGFGRIPRYLDLLNTEQYLAMRNEAHQNDNSPIQSYEYDLLDYDKNSYTNWQKVFLGGTARMTNAQVSLTGGTANTSFVFGTGYYGESTVLPAEFGDKKVNAHLGINHLSTDKRFNFSLTSNYVADNNKLPSSDPTGVALTTVPNAPAALTEEGTLNWSGVRWIGNLNPMSYMFQTTGMKVQNQVSNAKIGYEVIPGLVAKASIGYTTQQSIEVIKSPLFSLNPAVANIMSTSTFSSYSGSTWIVEPQLEYARKIVKGTLTALLGGTFQRSIREGSSVRGSGYTSDALLENLRAAASFQVLNTMYSQYKYSAVFGRLNYTWDNKYIINLTARRDGSSRFGPGNQFGNFGAVGGAWIISEENFLKHSPLISFAKLRSSYGITGSDQIADYGFRETFTATTYTYQGRRGVVPSRLANNEYGWETTRKTEVAIDLSFLKDRISLSAAYYRNRSGNQLVGYALPRITGFGSVQYNLPAVLQNSGYEFVFSTTNIERAGLRWTTSFNMTIPKDRLVSYPDIMSSSFANRWVVGESINKSKALHFLQVDPVTGYYVFEDVNQNGVGIDNPGDLQINKFFGKFYYGGFNNQLTYRGFELDITVQFAKQNVRDIRSSSFGMPGNIGNQPISVLDRWTNTGDVTSVQRYSMQTNALINHNAYIQSDATIVDGSFIRLRSVTLTYHVPGVLLDRMKVKTASVFVKGQNLYTRTPYLGFDPDIPVLGNMPPLKWITGGVTCTL